MSPPSPSTLEIHYELDGWRLFCALLSGRDGHQAELAIVRATVVEKVRRRHELATLASHPTVAALRRLFKAAGTSPSRYRPSSEALLRRLLKGQDLPAIHPLVDVNNCLSAELAVPCCVMVEGSFSPPLTLRAGVPGESYASLRGPFKLEGRPFSSTRTGPSTHRSPAARG